MARTGGPSVPDNRGQTEATWRAPKPDDLPDLALPEEACLRRRVRERLGRIEEIRRAHVLRVSGKSQREIADALETTQPRVERMLKAAQYSRADGDHPVTPEEVILRAIADDRDREQLVTDLAARHYTFRTYAPDPSDGAVPGTWDQVKQAYLTGLLSKEEYLRVRSAVRPPPLDGGSNS